MGKVILSGASGADDCDRGDRGMSGFITETTSSFIVSNAGVLLD
jgi:hypothetical protein